ncbi:hypothetical protein BJX99DRAFT_258141 [Aspergillus californicus]
MPVKWTPEKDQLLLLKILETHNLQVDVKKVAEAWPNDKEKPTPRAITERLVRMRALARNNSGNASHFSIGKGLGSGDSSTVSTPQKLVSTPSASQPNPNPKRKRGALKNQAVSAKDIDVIDDDDVDDSEALDVDYDEVEVDYKIFDTPTKKQKSTPENPASRGSLFSLSAPSSAIKSGLTPSSASGFTPINKGIKQEQSDIRIGSTLNLDMSVDDDVFGSGSPVKRSRTNRTKTKPYRMSSYTSYSGDEDDDEGDSESCTSEFLPDGPVQVDDDENFA